MKIKNQKSKKNNSSTLLPIIVILGIIVALAGISFIYVYALNGSILGWKKASDSTQKQTNINLTPPTKDQVDAGKDIKNESVNGGTPSTGPGTTPNTTTDISITATNQDNTSSVYQIRSIISAVIGSGTCTINLTKGSTTVTKTASIQAQSNNSTCRGFDIPLSELSAGQWNIQLSFSGSGMSGSTNSTITVN